MRGMTLVNYSASSAERPTPRMSPERILVGVDFRQPSLAAARWAAAHFGTCAIELAHVLPIPEVPAFLRPSMPALDDRLKTASASPLPALRGFAGTLGVKNLSVEVRVGPTVDSLAEAAATFGADLVVLGRKALDGSRGRTLERLIRRLAVPALVVDGHVRGSPRRILAAVDDASVGRNVVEWAGALAQHFGAELTLLHALSQSLLSHQWLWEERACESDSVSLGRARVSRADLIVVGRNGAHAMSTADIGSATRLTLRATKVPILVVPSTDTLGLRHWEIGVEQDLRRKRTGEPRMTIGL